MAEVERPTDRSAAAPERAGLASIASGRGARVAVLCVGAAILCHRIDVPFSGYFDWNSAYYAYFARNHIEYGLGYTELYCTHGHTATPPTDVTRYVNHPPLLCAWAALPMAVLGDHEWVARLVPILATLGSAWVLMTIVGGLHSASLALLSGFFFITLPIVGYFGRMLDHVPVVQLASLLMLHGFLRWRGLYLEPGSRRLGVILYGTAVVLGIGTGWAAALMAGAIGLWGVVRVARGRDAPGSLVALVLVPALALAAVVAHIAAATDFDLGYFGELLWTRSVGVRPEGEQPWLAWAAMQVRYALSNFTAFGVAAALALAPLLTLAIRGAGEDPLLAERDRRLAVPVALIALQGLVYVVLFKNQSWIHEYWQFFLAPAVAVALATVVRTLYAWTERRWRGAAPAAMVVLVLLPLPWCWSSWQRYHQLEHIPREYLDVYIALADRIPAKAPVMTWRDWHVHEEAFGGYVHRYTQPQIAYHAHRPLVFEREPEAIVANASSSAAYVLELSPGDSAAQALAAFLRERFETFEIGEHHLVALLDRGPSNPRRP